VGAHHREAEAQEGQVGRRSLNVARWRGPILTRTEALKTTKGVAGDVLGSRSRACWFPRLGRGKRNQREERQEGTPGVKSFPGLGERSKPLKGEPHERHLPETWQDGGGRKKSLGG
jgi:hypothetical protein